MSGVTNSSSGGSGSTTLLNYTLTKFTSSGTWNKLPTTKSVTVFVLNGGSGGGSGRQAGSTASGGGGGGAPGGGLVYNILSEFINSSETITVGAGGNGGSAQASINSNGNPGSTGGLSTFGANIGVDFTNAATGGGAGGTATIAAGGNAVWSNITWSSFFLYGTSSNATTLFGGTSGNGTNTGGGTALGSPSTSSVNAVIPGGSGGGGAGADSITIRSGGVGGQIFRLGSTANSNQQALTTPYIVGGTGGTESGTINGGDGNPATNTLSGRVTGGSGGGGGGGQSVGSVSGKGGNGGIPCGAGGGGGGSIDGTSSGAGGNGARGEVWVYEFA